MCSWGEREGGADLLSNFCLKMTESKIPCVLWGGGGGGGAGGEVGVPDLPTFQLLFLDSKKDKITNSSCPAEGRGGWVADLFSNFCSWVQKWQNPKFPMSDVWGGGMLTYFPTFVPLFENDKIPKSTMETVVLLGYHFVLLTVLLNKSKTACSVMIPVEVEVKLCEKKSCSFQEKLVRLASPQGWRPLRVILDPPLLKQLISFHLNLILNNLDLQMTFISQTPGHLVWVLEGNLSPSHDSVYVFHGCSLFLFSQISHHKL